MPSINYIAPTSVSLTPTYVAYGSYSGITGQSNFTYDGSGHLAIGKTFNNFGGYGNAIDLNGGITQQRNNDAANLYNLTCFSSGGNLLTSIYTAANADYLYLTNYQSGYGIQFNFQDTTGHSCYSYLDYRGFLIHAYGTENTYLSAITGTGSLGRILATPDLVYIQSLTAGSSYGPMLIGASTIEINCPTTFDSTVSATSYHIPTTSSYGTLSDNGVGRNEMGFNYPPNGAALFAPLAGWGNGSEIQIFGDGHPNYPGSLYINYGSYNHAISDDVMILQHHKNGTISNIMTFNSNSQIVLGTMPSGSGTPPVGLSAGTIWLDTALGAHQGVLKVY